MNISPINFNNHINFTSKKAEVKKADDIMRASVTEFPMMSCTRANNFYSSCKNPLSPSYMRAGMINQYLRSNIRTMRHDIDSQSSRLGIAHMLDMTADDPIINVLDAVKKKKIGNCSEAARAALAALYANCYYNSTLAYPSYQINVIDKRTGRIAAESASCSIDHVLVLTDMGKGKKKDIIVDPWLGFADYKSKAKEKYLPLVEEFDKEEVFNKVERNLINELREQGYEYYNRKNYIFREEVCIREDSKKEEEILKKLTACKVREKYPNLMLYNRRKALFGEEEK